MYTKKVENFFEKPVDSSDSKCYIMEAVPLKEVRHSSLKIKDKTVHITLKDF